MAGMARSTSSGADETSTWPRSTASFPATTESSTAPQRSIGTFAIRIAFTKAPWFAGASLPSAARIFSAIPGPACASIAAIASVRHAPTGSRAAMPPTPTPSARCAANGVATSATTSGRTRAAMAPRTPPVDELSCSLRTPAAMPEATGPMTRSAVRPASGCTIASMASAWPPRATAAEAAAWSTTPVASRYAGSSPTSGNLPHSGTSRSPAGPTGRRSAIACAPSASKRRICSGSSGTSPSATFWRCAERSAVTAWHPLHAIARCCVRSRMAVSPACSASDAAMSPPATSAATASTTRTASMRTPRRCAWAARTRRAAAARTTGVPCVALIAWPPWRGPSPGNQPRHPRHRARRSRARGPARRAPLRHLPARHRTRVPLPPPREASRR